MSELENDLESEGHSAGASAAQLHGLNDRLALYEKINWTALRAKDPADAQEFWLQFMQTREARDALLKHLQRRGRDEGAKAERDKARRIEDAHAALAHEVEDWNPEIFERVKELGAHEFGFTPEEIADVNDPRMLKVLYRLFINKQGKVPVAAEQTASEFGAPRSKAGARAPNSLSDEEQIEDWMRRRNDQLRRSFVPVLSNFRR